MNRRIAALLTLLLSVLLAPLVPASATDLTPATSDLSGRFTGKVKIAAVQTSPVFRDKAHNLADMSAKAEAAAAQGADLIVFPELSLTGYKYKTTAEGLEDAEPVPGPSTDAMAAVAKATGAYLTFGMVESDGTKLFDSVVLVGPEGYVGKYAKITMGHRSEGLLFTRGETPPPVFETSIGRIGLASCYDGAFPENARILGLQGAQIMVLIDTENGTTWRDYVRSRAVENGAFAVVANRIGEERLSTFNGYSLIADPHYNLLANASTDQVETIYATVDLGDAVPTYLGQRRPELYRALTQPLDSAVLGVRLSPQSNVTGSDTAVSAVMTTGGIRAGATATLSLEGPSGDVVATGSGTVGVDQARVDFTVPASTPPGDYTARVKVGSQELTSAYTVKDIARPGSLGTLPEGSSAAPSSTAYVGFDTDLTPSSTVPATITGPGGSTALTGSVNMSGTDNRVAFPYSGLSYGQTYQVVLPADAVHAAAGGTGNQEVRFSFTVRQTPQTVDAAAAQMGSVPLDVTTNLTTVLGMMDDAATSGTKLVVFPELSLTGTAFADRDEALSVAEPATGTSIAAVEAKAAELGIYAAVGFVESSGTKLYNSVALVGPDGLIGVHRNTQLSDDEVGIFDAGKSVSPVFDTPVGPIGLTVGYENYFPEVIRSLSIRGALVISGSYAEPGTIWRELARTRGSENKVYVIGANQTTAGGQSLIASTSRTINAQSATAAPGRVTATLNLTTIAERGYSYVDRSIAQVRTTHYFLDRRPYLYSLISRKSATTTTLALSRASVVLGGDAVVATVQVTSDDIDLPQGDVILTDGETVLAHGQVVDGTWVGAVPSTVLRSGQRTLSATYIGSGDFETSAARTPLTVAKAASKVSSRLVRATVRSGTATRVVVQVTADGISQVAGVVRVTVAGRVRVARLVAGTVTLKLPKIRVNQTRTYRVRVSYAGSEAVTSGTAAPRVLTVRG